MASPSEIPANPGKKDGIRCDGVLSAGHKFAGETCNALLLEKDPELGVGARCGRCGTFHPVSEFFQKIPQQTKVNPSRKQRREQMERAIHQKKDPIEDEKYRVYGVVDKLLVKAKTGELLEKKIWGDIDREDTDGAKTKMLLVWKDGTSLRFSKSTSDMIGFPYLFIHYTISITTEQGAVLVSWAGECKEVNDGRRLGHHALCRLWKKIKKVSISKN
jgi:hypothetical protein